MCFLKSNLLCSAYLRRSPIIISIVTLSRALSKLNCALLFLIWAFWDRSWPSPFPWFYCVIFHGVATLGSFSSFIPLSYNPKMIDSKVIDLERGVSFRAHKSIVLPTHVANAHARLHLVVQDKEFWVRTSFYTTCRKILICNFSQISMWFFMCSPGRKS